MIKKIIFLILFFTVSVQFFAKDLFVSTDGSDDTTYANNDISHPWATPLKAWTEAKAGDTVFFRSGTYLINTPINTKYTGNDGIAGSPIIFRNYDNEIVEINSSTVSPIFIIERDFNYVQGISFEGIGTCFAIGTDTLASNFKISNCSYQMTVGGDNVSFVQLGERSPNAIIEKCKIVGPGLQSSGVHQNTNCIFAARASKIKILNNEMSNAPIGFYFKHANNPLTETDIEIAYNYIHDVDRQSIFLNSNYANVHDNLIGANCAGFDVNEANGVPGGDNNTINHNTIYSGGLNLAYDTQSGDPLPGAINNTVKNNLFIKSFMVHRYSSIVHNTILDYNLYPSTSAIIENSIVYDLTTWRSHNNQDTNSASGTPIFAGGETPSTIAGFALTSESPGYQSGSDSRDMGAEVSLVGTQPVTATISSTGLGATETQVAAGVRYTYTLIGTTWDADLGSDSAESTAFCASITGSLNTATSWNNTGACAYGDLTRASDTVLHYDTNKGSYDIAQAETITFGAIPASATALGETITPSPSSTIISYTAPAAVEKVGARVGAPGATVNAKIGSDGTVNMVIGN